MNTVRRFFSARHYGIEDLRVLDHVYVSHVRFNTAVVCMGAAFVGISYWLNDMKFSALNKSIAEVSAEMKQDFAEIRRDFAETSAEMKHDFAEMKRSIQQLLEK